MERRKTIERKGFKGKEILKKVWKRKKGKGMERKRKKGKGKKEMERKERKGEEREREKKGQGKKRNGRKKRKGKGEEREREKKEKGKRKGRERKGMESKRKEKKRKERNGKGKERKRKRKGKEREGKERKEKEWVDNLSLILHTISPQPSKDSGERPPRHTLSKGYRIGYNQMFFDSTTVISRASSPTQTMPARTSCTPPPSRWSERHFKDPLSKLTIQHYSELIAMFHFNNHSQSGECELYRESSMKIRNNTMQRSCLIRNAIQYSSQAVELIYFMDTSTQDNTQLHFKTIKFHNISTI